MGRSYWQQLYTPSGAATSICRPGTLPRIIMPVLSEKLFINMGIVDVFLVWFTVLLNIFLIWEKLPGINFLFCDKSHYYFKNHQCYQLQESGYWNFSEAKYAQAITVFPQQLWALRGGQWDCLPGNGIILNTTDCPEVLWTLQCTVYHYKWAGSLPVLCVTRGSFWVPRPWSQSHQCL